MMALSVLHPLLAQGQERVASLPAWRPQLRPGCGGKRRATLHGCSGQDNMSLSCLMKQQQHYGFAGVGWPGRVTGAAGEGPRVVVSGEGTRWWVMSVFPSGSVMCACQVNSLEIDGRKAADGACDWAGAALLNPCLPAATQTGSFPCLQGSRNTEE